MQRRLALQAAASASTLWLPRSTWSQTRFNSNPFALGIASGSPAPDGMVLWTRLAPEGKAIEAGDITVRWEIAHDESFQHIVQSGQTTALAQLAHSVHVEPGGLPSDRVFFYRFHVGEYTSPVGRTRTLPAVDASVKSLRLTYASCQRWEHGYFSAYRHMKADDPDLVIFLGDYIYEYPGLPNAVRWPNLTALAGWTVSLDDYRARYALYKSDADLQAMHAHCPWILTWDDHEVQNDYAGIHAGDQIPPLIDFAERRKAAYQAYYEHMPLRASTLLQGVQGLTTGKPIRLYEAYRFGQLGSLTMLDTRQHKDAPACSSRLGLATDSLDPSSCAIWNDPARSMLGSTQEKWLAEQLSIHARASGWHMLGQSTLLGSRAQRGKGSTQFWNDGWDGYSPARQRLLDTVQRTELKNFCVLGGDIHEHWVGHVKSDYNKLDSKTIGVEFCGTSISATPSRSTVNKAAERLADNPHFIYAEPRYRGYGIVDLQAQRLRVRLRGLSDVKRVDASISTLTSFEVADGSSKIDKIA